MVVGEVKWFDAKLGYGFLRTANVDKDIFVHFTKIQMEGFRKLDPGQQVEFELVQSDNGPQAVSVVPRGE